MQRRYYAQTRIGGLRPEKSRRNLFYSGTSLASPITYSQLPPDAVVIDSMAVFKKKTDGRHKVRIVVSVTW